MACITLRCINGNCKPNLKFLAFLVELLVVILHTKFEVSSFSRYRDIEGVPKFNSGSRDPEHAPFIPNFAFLVELLVVILHTKFEASSFSRYRDIEGVPKFKSRSSDLGHAPFVP